MNSLVVMVWPYSPWDQCHCNFPLIWSWNAYQVSNYAYPNGALGPYKFYWPWLLVYSLVTVCLASLKFFFFVSTLYSWIMNILFHFRFVYPETRSNHLKAGVWHVYSQFSLRKKFAWFWKYPPVSIFNCHKLICTEQQIWWFNTYQERPKMKNELFFL